MAPVFRSLAEITTGHAVFEADQVLSHAQLNSVADYADDQIRLSRVRLLGVGIACGLRVSLGTGTVIVTRGVGVTTDGDILSLDADVVYDRFKPYDASFPAYAPLYTGGDLANTVVPVFELVPVGATDDRASSLGGFDASARRALGGTTAVLLMESYVTDTDPCTGGDCDNRGETAINTLKLLVLDDTGALGRLRESVGTAGAAFGGLPELGVERPRIPASLTAAADLAKIYRDTCANIRSALGQVLPELARRCSAFLGDAITSTSADRWLARLDTHAASFTAGDASVQYYYDLLRDVADTYAELRERHLDDTTVCAPAVDGFPKHLLLGRLTPGADPAADRTGFYPSPLIGRAQGEGAHARFLARKLDLLTERFTVAKSASAPIRVTPSAFDDRPLEERAIPFYYDAGSDPAMHGAWSYRLAQRGATRSAYSYHADTYAAAGTPAADPLARQIGRYPFFRVEGHVGRKVADALTELEALVASRNLPFGVRAVMLGTEPAKVLPPPHKRYTDLHHLHHILRKDIARRVGEAKVFGAALKDQIVTAVTDKVIVDSSGDTDGGAVRTAATEHSISLGGSADAAASKLSGDYPTYRGAAGSWKQDVRATMSTASQAKRELGVVVQTELVSPFDVLSVATHVDWLPWLDTIIDAKDAKADERVLFNVFAVRHPQVEHLAGTTRGGTFVLLYDTNGVVVADVALPYYCCEPADDVVEPPLDEPDIRPPVVKGGGVRVGPSRATVIEKVFDSRWLKVRPEIDTRLELQDKYLGMFTSAAGGVRGTTGTPNTTPNASSGSDAYLADLNRRMAEKQREMVDLRERASQPKQPKNVQAEYARQIEQHAVEASQLVQAAADFIAVGGVTPTTGSTAEATLQHARDTMGTLSGTLVFDATTRGMQGIIGRTEDVGLKGRLGAVIGQ